MASPAKIAELSSAGCVLFGQAHSHLACVGSLILRPSRPFWIANGCEESVAMAMAKRVVLENEFVLMWFHPEAGVVHHQFRKYIWGDAFREVLNEGLRVFALEGASKWLSDDRENGALSKADTEWSMGDWFPRVMKVGWKYWAIVLPQNVIGQMNIERFIAIYSEQGLKVRVFNEPNSALIWLENVDKP